MSEFDFDKFLEAHGISHEVAKHFGFEYFEVGATDFVAETCMGFGKDDEDVRNWSKMFSDTDGITEPRYDLSGNAVMPEMKVFWPVKTGPAKNHVHVDVGGRGWQMQTVLQFVPSVVLAAYIVVSKPSPPKEVKLLDGSTATKWGKYTPDGRKKLVFRHTHSQLTAEELDEHLETFHGVNKPKADKVHSHSVSCYGAGSATMQNHINKGREVENSDEEEWYKPSRRSSQ